MTEHIEKKATPRGAARASKASATAQPADGAAAAAVAEAKTPLLAATAAEEIKRLIYAGDIAPGARLNEAALAQQMGISRGPIREAIRILAGSGLVTAVPHRGMFVRQMSMRDMLESYDLRALIFGFAARRATEHLSPEREADLDSQLAAMEAATAISDGSAYYELNLRFHDTILAYSNNRHAARAYTEYVNELHLFRRKFFNYTAKMHRSNQEHRAMVDAIKAGNVVLAGELAEQHVLAGKQRLLADLAD
ncbi:Transcriptional regulator, GntR family [plant metagenome]|uniref:Transcriptional regulator, GntR family n=1 Tax=plant metagenome TaxID=1297885 RepID=A0A484RC33_9ZZZZ